jgi:hypothetical protein
MILIQFFYHFLSQHAYVQYAVQDQKIYIYHVSCLRMNKYLHIMYMHRQICI